MGLQQKLCKNWDLRFILGRGIWLPLASIAPPSANDCRKVSHPVKVCFRCASAKIAGSGIGRISSLSPPSEARPWYSQSEAEWEGRRLLERIGAPELRRR
jgi:hypothetical protein